MGDLVKTLRSRCHCNIDSTPCGAEEDCRIDLNAADEIERLRGALTDVTDAVLRSRYGLQAVQEDFGHDANAENYEARRYYERLISTFEGAARDARAVLKGGEDG